MTDPLADIRSKLVFHHGEREAERIISDAVMGAKLVFKSSYTPDELLRIAEALIAHGGYVELLGRSLKMKAMVASMSSKK